MTDFPRDCRDCPVWKQSLFSNIDADTIAWLTQRKKTVERHKKEILFSQGQAVAGIYCHLRGLAKVVQNDDNGNVRFSRLVLPGDSSGHRSLFIETNYKGTASVVSDTLQSCYIPKDDILHLLATNPSFAKNLVVRISRELTRSEEETLSVKEKSVRSRLAKLLVELCEADAEKINDGQFLILSAITKVEFAGFLSVANETMIRLMSDLKNEGLISFEGKKIVVNDLDKLKAIATE